MLSPWDDLTGWRIRATVATVIFLLLNSWAGHIFMPDISTTALQYRDLGGAIALPVIGGVCLFVVPALNISAQNAIMLSAKSSGLTLRHVTIYAQLISNIPRQTARYAIVLGPLIATSYMAIEGLLYNNDLSVYDNIRRMILWVQAAFLWFGLILLVVSLVRVTIINTRFITRHLRIDLFNVEELLPLVDNATLNMIACAVIMSLSPLFWLGREIPLTDIVILIGLSGVLLFLVLFPVFKIRQLVLQKKKAAIIELQLSVREVMQEQLTEEVMLAKVQKLDQKQLRLSAIRPWPVNMQVSYRFFIVFCLPFASWAFAWGIDWLVTRVFS